MNIFVSNLGFHVESNDLRNLFTPYGEVTSANVVTERETNRSRGFGFVEMTNKNEGMEAIDKLNGNIVEGRALTVNEARPKEKKKFW
ncbi:RNA-binding protein [Russula earlei]|uniref:RNA-binding protein n=1 Tax=Russula earlei TaxID=71964 RepID=A0ACC0TWJ5_9AGAM|nr:RNA-binding protein [Russula earlei]